MKKYYQKHRLGTITLIWLAVIMTVALVVSSVVGFLLQAHYRKQQAFSMIRDYLSQNIKMISAHERINEYFDEWMDEIIDPEGASRKKEHFDNDKLSGNVMLNNEYFCQVSVVDREGIIAFSSDPQVIGTDIRTDAHLAPFACLLEGEASYSDSFTSSPFTDSVKMAYVGKAFRDKSGFMLWGLNEENYRDWELYRIKTATEFSKIGMTGYIINCEPDKRISSVTNHMAEKAGESFPAVSVLPEEEGVYKESVCELYGEMCYVVAVKTPDFYAIGAYPVAEAEQFQLQNNILFAALFILALGVFFAAAFIVLRKTVIKGVEKTHASLNRIAEGDLEEKVDVRGSLEFSELSSDINETVDRLKGLIKAEDDRIKNELLHARYIQESAVPGIFPPYPDHMDFGLFASMDTAEEVGGDFYDFFMTDANTLVIVMADVCGKGLPAALYMMHAKTLIKSCAERGLPVEEVAKEVNNKLCRESSGNASMFLTAWLGFLDLPSGILSFVHAGHTFPLYVSGKKVSYLEREIDIILGAFGDMDYTRQELRLQPGDSICLYTDGVTEALDPDGNLYGDERLLSFVTELVEDLDAPDRNAYCREACERLHTEIKRYAADAKQSDDITMLWLKYCGKE